ncbi:neuronal acetylcholine receptor subunit non-alpha-3-like [Saccoglossus kowalevskii]
MELLNKLFDDAHYLRSSVETEESQEEMMENWKYVAMVTDRLFFWMSLLGYCIGSLVILGNSALHFN